MFIPLSAHILSSFDLIKDLFNKHVCNKKLFTQAKRPLESLLLHACHIDLIKSNSRDIITEREIKFTLVLTAFNYKHSSWENIGTISPLC